MLRRSNEALGYYEAGLGRPELTASSKRELENRIALIQRQIGPESGTAQPQPQP